MAGRTQGLTRSIARSSPWRRTMARSPPRCATKSRTRPWLISSCMSWCRKKRGAGAHDSSQLLRRAVALRAQGRRNIEDLFLERGLVEAVSSFIEGLVPWAGSWAQFGSLSARDRLTSLSAPSRIRAIVEGVNCRCARSRGNSHGVQGDALPLTLNVVRTHTVKPEQSAGARFGRRPSTRSRRPLAAPDKGRREER